MPMNMENQTTDKWQAAVHEAGHAIVAIVLGFPRVLCWLIPNDPDDDTLDKYWAGKMQPKTDSPLVSLAGFIAERLDADSEVNCHEIVEEILLDENRLSATDRDGLAEQDLNETRLTELVKRTVKLLREHSARHREIASELFDFECFATD